MHDPIDTFSDADLIAMERRAYREAARAWSEVRSFSRQSGHKDVAAMLQASAESAQAFWNHVNTARRERGLTLDAS